MKWTQLARLPQFFGHQYQRGGLPIKKGLQLGIEQSRDTYTLRPGMPYVQQRLIVKAGLQDMIPFGKAVAIGIIGRARTRS